MAGEPQIVCHPTKGPLLFIMSPDLLSKYEITLTNAGLFRVNGGPPMAGDEVKSLLFAELDTNNLTDTLLSKLNAIEALADVNPSDSEIETSYNNEVSVISQAEAEAGSSTTVRRWTAERVAQAIAALESGDAVSSVAGKTGVVLLDMDDLSETGTGKIFSDTERTKLTGIETNATADQSDAEIETAYGNQVTVITQVEAEAGTSTTVRRWTAERVADAIAALAPGGGGSLNNNYLNAYDTTTQAISSADTFQDFTFSDNSILDGWTHTANTNIFACNQTGVFEVIISCNARKTSGGSAETIGIRALFNGTEIAGSFGSIGLNDSGDIRELTSAFLFNGVSGQDLTIECEGSATSVDITPGPTGTSPTTNPSAKITIRRVT